MFAPVYVLFTKVDLIPGFHEFFLDLDWNERDRVWGATIPYEQAGGNELIALFDRHFDELYEGLRAMSVAQMSRLQGEATPPGLLTFPAEFASIKPALRAFIATLFEDNPFQFKPVFRGFYLSSALQGADFEPVSNPHIVRRFGLVDAPVSPPPAGNHGYFLRQLFSKVVFPDRNLVRQHSTRHKTLLRQGAVLAWAPSASPSPCGPQNQMSSGPPRASSVRGVRRWPRASSCTVSVTAGSAWAHRVCRRASSASRAASRASRSRSSARCTHSSLFLISSASLWAVS